MRSQIYDRCIASANSPSGLIQKGLYDFMYLYNISADRLVLGQPWYGHGYPCVNWTSTTDRFCETTVVVPPAQLPATCSDASAPEMDYSEILLLQSTTGRMWDGQPVLFAAVCLSAIAHCVLPLLAPFPSLPFPPRFRSPPPADTLQAPYLNFMTAGNTLNQMWYDDPQSLVVKYQLAVDKGLRGISVWHIDAVPYTTNASAADDMWVRWRQRGCDADVVALTDYSQTGHPCQVFPCQTRLITL